MPPSDFVLKIKLSKIVDVFSKMTGMPPDAIQDRTVAETYERLLKHIAVRSELITLGRFKVVFQIRSNLKYDRRKPEVLEQAIKEYETRLLESDARVEISQAGDNLRTFGDQVAKLNKLLS